MEKKFGGKGFLVIGIHTPEFKFEHARRRVVAATERFGIKYPVMMDNDYAFWNALNNRYWPAFYIVDKSGNIVGSFAGEMHSNTERARVVEDIIEKMLEQS